jgi:hypothetical protein
MSKLLNFKDTVAKVLEEKPESRNNDYILYFFVIQELDNHPVTSMLDMSLADALRAMSKGEIPPIDSITRLRRLVQEEASKDPSKQYLCGDRTGKKGLANQVSAEIINDKKENQ